MAVLAPLAMSAFSAVTAGGTLAGTLGAIGTGLSALGTIKQGQAAGASAKYNANVAEQNAQITEQQGKAQEEAAQRESRLRYGSNIAGASASGVGVGSFGDVLKDNAMQDELDLLTIRQNTNLRKQGFMQDAALTRAEGKSARQASYIGAGTKLLTRVGM